MNVEKNLGYARCVIQPHPSSYVPSSCGSCSSPEGSSQRETSRMSRNVPFLLSCLFPRPKCRTCTVFSQRQPQARFHVFCLHTFRMSVIELIVKILTRLSTGRNSQRVESSVILCTHSMVVDTRVLLPFYCLTSSVFTTIENNQVHVVEWTLK